MATTINVKNINNTLEHFSSEKQGNDLKDVRNGKTYRNGRLHSFKDKPAEIRVNGDQCWYKNGKLHRNEDKPAEIRANGTQCWYQNGNLHRDEDKPAEIWADDSQLWYQNRR